MLLTATKLILSSEYQHDKDHIIYARAVISLHSLKNSFICTLIP